MQEQLLLSLLLQSYSKAERDTEQSLPLIYLLSAFISGGCLEAWSLQNGSMSCRAEIRRVFRKITGLIQIQFYRMSLLVFGVT